MVRVIPIGAEAEAREVARALGLKEGEYHVALMDRATRAIFEICVQDPEFQGKAEEQAAKDGPRMDKLAALAAYIDGRLKRAHQLGAEAGQPCERPGECTLDRADRAQIADSLLRIADAEIRHAMKAKPNA